jgi:hypothetical protein
MKAEAQIPRKPSPGQKAGDGIRTGLGFIGEVFSAFTTINRYRIAAVLIWFIGVFTTSVVINAAFNQQYGVNSQLESITIGIYTSPLIGAFVVQFIFTTIESPIFRGKGGGSIYSLIVLVIDAAINSVLVRPLVEGFVISGAWGFLRDLVREFSRVIFNSTGNISAGIDIGSGTLVVLILTLIGSVGIAGAPEWLWHIGTPRKVMPT